MPDEQPTDNQYMKVYNKGQYEIRIGRDVKKFFAAIYVQGRREDTLTHHSPDGLEKKVDRYLSGAASENELESVKQELDKARKENAALTKSLTEMGDSNAKCAEYERELDEQNKKIEKIEKENAQLRTDVEQYRADLEAARGANSKQASGKDEKDKEKTKS